MFRPAMTIRTDEKHLLKWQIQLQLFSIILKVKQLEQKHKCIKDGSPPLGTKSESLALRRLIINLWATRTPYLLRLYAVKG